ncbi:7947_t:CDS:2, partial [Funneliformis geosporum]
MVVYRGKNKKTQVTTKKRRQWCACKKLPIVNHTEYCESKHLAARKFEVEIKQICYWMNQKFQLESVSDLCKDAKVITQNMMIRKAKLVAKEKNG